VRTRTGGRGEAGARDGGAGHAPEPRTALPRAPFRQALARRPLATLALALVLGQGLGGPLAERARALGAFPAPAHRVGAALVALAALLLLRRWAGRRGGSPPLGAGHASGPARLPLWGLAVLLLAFARSAAAASGPGGEATAGNPPGPAAGLWSPRDCERVVVGRWRARGRRAGVLEGAAGCVFLADPAPADGSWVAVLPGGELLLSAAGPAAPARTPLRALSPDELVVLAEPRPALLGRLLAPLERRLERARESGLARLARARERDGPSAELLGALLLGESSAVARELEDLFRRTGTRHLLAVSGLHVGLVVGLVLLPLARRAARFGRAGGRAVAARGADARLERRSAVATLALLAAYAALVGMGPPVVRAALAFGCALLAPLLPVRFGRGPGRHDGPCAPGRRDPDRRRADGLSLLSLAASLELLASRGSIDSLGSIGLWLSYAATLGLVLGTRGARAQLRARPFLAGDSRAGTGPLLASRPSPVRILALRLRRATEGALAASLAATLATLPFVWKAFGEWSPVGILATPLALPLVALALLLGWAGLLGLVPLDWSRPALDALVALLEACDSVPWTPAVLPPRPSVLVWMAALGTLAVWSAWSSWGRPIGRATLLAWAALLAPWTSEPEGLELHALDVGNGTCVALRAPGAGTLVFDAGSRDRRDVFESALRPLLARWETRRPTVVLSHPHRDHASALGELVERFPPRLVAGTLPDDVLARLPRDTPHLELGDGSSALPLPGTLLAARWLRAGGLVGNEGSASLELEGLGRRVLLTGDAEQDGLERQPDLGRLCGPLDVLLFPHHGSETRLLAELLAATAPREVWISASGPAAVEAELERRGLPWRRTGHDGPLELLQGPAPAPGAPPGDQGPLRGPK